MRVRFKRELVCAILVDILARRPDVFYGRTLGHEPTRYVFAGKVDVTRSRTLLIYCQLKHGRVRAIK